MRYPGTPVPLLTAAVSDPEFEMSQAELMRQTDRMEAAKARDKVAREEIEAQIAVREHAKKQKTPEQREAEKAKRAEKQKRKAHSLQMDRLRYFRTHKPSW